MELNLNSKFRFKHKIVFFSSFYYLSFLLCSCVSYPSPQEGCAAIMMLLLRHGAKITSRDGHGVTPLGIAAEHGNSEVLDILIHHGKTVYVVSCLIKTS